MKRLQIGMIAAMMALGASAQEHIVSWNAEDAFIDAGILESYGSIDGKTWHLGECVDLTFTRGSSDREPQNVFSPEACAWMCYGAEMTVRCIEKYELIEIKVKTVAGYPFVDGEAEVTTGTIVCTGNEAVWTGEHGINEVTLSQPGPYETIHSPGGRVAVSAVEVTYWLKQPQSGIETVETGVEKQHVVHDLTGRRIVQPSKGVYVIDGALRKL